MYVDWLMTHRLVIRLVTNTNYRQLLHTETRLGVLAVKK